MQAGDMVETFADIEDLTRDVGFTPQTPIIRRKGIRVDAPSSESKMYGKSRLITNNKPQFGCWIKRSKRTRAISSSSTWEVLMWPQFA